MITTTTAVTAPANPCAHRILCGPIHLIPRSANGKMVLYATLADALVTVIETHGKPALEGDPTVRPFVQPGAFGFATMLIGMGANHAMTRIAMRAIHVPAHISNSMILGAHVAGIASWLSSRTYPGDGIDTWVDMHSPTAEALWMRADLSASGAKQ